MKKAYFLFFVVFLEGYIVLSTELLAIRQIIPFVGSGTDTTSIIIAGVLLPLALGYYSGGQYKYKLGGKTIRQRLIRNIVISMVFLCFGLSYLIVHDFFSILTLTFLRIHSIPMTMLYTVVFIIYPIFLMAQTIPLVMNYFKHENLSCITGKMLFFSTLGSLMGALFSTLVLMTTMGVSLTATLTVSCLFLLYILLTKDKKSKVTALMIVLLLISYNLNKHSTLESKGIIQDNVYHTIQLETDDYGKRTLILNNTRAAGYDGTEKLSFEYMQYIETNFINPIKVAGEPRSILVIGSGGFTLGLADTKNNYQFVDIDGALKDIAEQYFLMQKLGPNKKFELLPARSYLQKAAQQDLKYDLIVVDAYSTAHIPEHLVTVEFFDSIKSRLNDDGIAVFNIITSSNFNEVFSVNIDKTLRTVFPLISRQVISPYNGWEEKYANQRNIIYSAYNKNDVTPKIYTDDKNTTVYDKYKVPQKR